MLDLALIQQCADPGIEIAIVERFIVEAGSDNPLAVSITFGNRLILPEAPQTADQAMTLLQHFVGQATVRVGVTLYPAGRDASDVGQLSADLFDACENIRMGTALFGKVYRIVAHAQGTSGGTVFREAITAWRTGAYDGEYVFGQLDPGPLLVEKTEAEATVAQMSAPALNHSEVTPTEDDQAPPFSAEDPHHAGIRVDLTGIVEAPQ